MFGVQVEWSQALGGVSVLVCEPAARLGPDGPIAAIEAWSGRREIAPGLALHRGRRSLPRKLGRPLVGRAPAAGASCSSSDTIHANPDRATVTFLRSYPNRIPLSAAVVERIT